MLIQDNYVRHAKAVSVYDGDTLTAEVDMWKGVTFEIKIRLKGINTAEVKGSTGERLVLARNAKEFVQSKLLNKKEIRIHSEKFEIDGFSRLLATVYYQEKGDWINLNEELLKQGLAQVYYKGASKDYGEWKE
jgi:micrococcal nuclease